MSRCQPSDRSGYLEIWLCNRDGSGAVQLTSLGRTDIGSPAWSPDGRRIAFDDRPDGHGDIFIVSAEGLTTEKSDDVVPTWSRDGRSIYFTSNRGGSEQLWKMPAEGGPALPVTRQGGFYAHEWSDGFLYYSKGRVTVPGVWRMPINGGEETPVLDRVRPPLTGGSGP